MCVCMFGGVGVGVAHTCSRVGCHRIDRLSTGCWVLGVPLARTVAPRVGWLAGQGVHEQVAGAPSPFSVLKGVIKYLPTCSRPLVGSSRRSALSSSRLDLRFFFLGPPSPSSSSSPCRVGRTTRAVRREGGACVRGQTSATGGVAGVAGLPPHRLAPLRRAAVPPCHREPLSLPTNPPTATKQEPRAHLFLLGRGHGIFRLFKLGVGLLDGAFKASRVAKRDNAVSARVNTVCAPGAGGVVVVVVVVVVRWCGGAVLRAHW